MLGFGQLRTVLAKHANLKSPYDGLGVLRPALAYMRLSLFLQAIQLKLASASSFLAAYC